MNAILYVCGHVFLLFRNVGNAEFFSSSNIVKYSIDIATICVEWVRLMLVAIEYIKYDMCQQSF